MGLLFRIPGGPLSVTVSERFTGANVLDAGRLSPYWGEHAARYAFALPFVGNRSVLDIACGTGYGLGILQGTARRVTGVDIDITGASEAKKECAINSSVLLADGLRLPFREESFDTVTSFETLEHLHDRSGFLAELRRVLRTGGHLVLSTPNANYTAPVNGTPANPFHVFEYNPGELERELSKHFRVCRFMGQFLSEDIRIPPFYEAQLRLPRDAGTRARLYGWKLLNKLPTSIREGLSETFWHKPFYPTEKDYLFSDSRVDDAPVLLAVCEKGVEDGCS